MKHLSPRLIVALLACLLPTAARALEFRFLAWDEKVAARPLAVLGSGDEGKGETTIKDLHPLKRSPAVDAKLKEANLLLRVLDKKDAEGKPVDFSVQVAANLTRPLVLLLPDAKAASGLRGFVLEDDVANFPWGSFRFLNGTGKDLGVALGSMSKPLAAGWIPLDFLPGGDKPLPVEIAIKDKNLPAPKPAYSAVWKADPNVRRLVFLIPGTEPRLGPLAIKIIPEDRKALDIEAEAGGGGRGVGEAGSGAGARSAEHRAEEEP